VATSNSYTFAPSNAELTIEAFARCGMPAQALLREHFFEARRSLNLELATWSLRGINLWEVDATPQVIPLAANTAVYVVDPETVTITDMYYSIVGGGGPGEDIDRIMLPMSRTEYAETPNKMQPGVPTRFWFQKLIAPQVTIWQVPQSNQVAPNFVLKFYRLRRIQDANPKMGEQPEVIWKFLDALCAGLAKRLAVKYAPERYAILEKESAAAWLLAADEDREDVPIQIRPDLSGYFRIR